MTDTAPATVNAKVQWSAHHFHTQDHRPHVGSHLSLLAPSQRPQPWPVTVVSMSGTNNEDIVLGFDGPTNPLPQGTQFELVWVGRNKTHHVIAIGETK